MQDIVAENLGRTYKVPIKSEHFWDYLFNRKYREVDAVCHVEFSIRHGEAVGLIGPNGAGKSTIIKMLTGILVPSTGSVTVLGRNPFKAREKNATHIGVVFGQRSQLWWELPVEDTLLLLKKVYKVSDENYERNLKRYGKILEMEDYLKQPVRQLSLGQRMRAELLACLMHNPQILFLDEPTIGLDVVVKKQIRQLLREINHEEHITIVLTSHDMKDIDIVCDRLIVINHGQIVIDDSVEQIKNTYRTRETLIVTLEHEVESKCFLPFSDMDIREEEGNWIVSYDKKAFNSAEVIKYIMDRHKIKNFQIVTSDIDEIIENIYKK